MGGYSFLPSESEALSVAASFSITVDTKQIARLAKRLSPREISRRGHAAMQESVAYLQGAVQRATPVDTGVTRGTIFTEVRGRELAGMRGIVASPLVHTIVLEFGRRPGQRMPPLGPIRVWLHHQGKDERLAFVVARSIGRKGTKAHHMFSAAAERGASMVTAIWQRHFRSL